MFLDKWLVVLIYHRRIGHCTEIIGYKHQLSLSYTSNTSPNHKSTTTALVLRKIVTFGTLLAPEVRLAVRSAQEEALLICKHHAVSLLIALSAKSRFDMTLFWLWAGFQKFHVIFSITFNMRRAVRTETFSIVASSNCFAMYFSLAATRTSTRLEVGDNLVGLPCTVVCFGSFLFSK